MNLPPDLPTGPMAPLPPRPGALADVLAGARARRNHRLAALGGSVTVLLLALSIPLVLRDGDGRPAQQVQTADDDREDAVTSTTTSTSVAPVVDEGTDDTVPATTTTTTTPDPLEHYDLDSPAWLVGRAIDPDGKPVHGVFVYDGVDDYGVPRPVTSTDEHGYYQIPCPDDTVVLSGAQINTYAGEHSGDQNWVPVIVEPRAGGTLAERCGRGEVLITNVQYGGVIEGVVVGMNETSSGGIYAAIDSPWPGADNQGFPMDAHFESFVWGDGTFRFLGLPAGDVTLYRVKSSWSGDSPPEWITDVVHVESGQITRVELQAPPRDPHYTP